MRRWYSTVLGLMNRWVAISRSVLPSAARRAICASCGVSWSCVSTVRFRACRPSPPARPVHARRTRHPEVAKEVVGNLQLLAAQGVGVRVAAIRRREGEHGQDRWRSGFCRVADRLDVELFSMLAFGEECLGACRDPESPVCAASPVMATRRRRASIASSGVPARAAASTNSAMCQLAGARSCGCSAVRNADARASSYRPSPLYRTASAHSSTEIPIPSPRRVTSTRLPSMSEAASVSRPRRARSPTPGLGA